MSLRVRAIRRGVYGTGLRREGDVFSIVHEGHFSPAWMVRVSDEIPECRATAQQALTTELEKMSPLRSSRRVCIPVDPAEDQAVLRDFDPFETKEN